MKGFAIMAAAAAALTLTACGPAYERQPQPVYQPPPSAQQPPPRDYGAYRSRDGEIHEQVHEALTRAPSLRGTEIGVSVHHGQVSLSGSVDSERQRQAAHDVAHSVPGVESVQIGDLRVRY